MQLGFVIDHARCIGCHACTVACKAENDVPLGRFRTWVKYTESGRHPEVRRSFAVLRCNQCTDAPCVTICPVRALAKRADGIVDVDPAACIGCKACMQGCPYDALYIHPDHGTAQKCHFCAHRTERGLAPACAVVCPTEAIVPGDFDDADSVVSRMRRDLPLKARKVEARTGPNVYYRDAAPAGLDPLATNASGGYLWAARAPGMPLDAERAAAALAEAEEQARTTYDVDHAPLWGARVSSYLVTKSLAAGLFLVQAALAPLLLATANGRGLLAGLSVGSLFFLAVTSILLVADLKRPERFLFILLRPNPRSWLVRGTWVLLGFGLAAAAWPALLLRSPQNATGPPGTALLVAGGVLAALAAAYTGWLFGQARGRVLWMRRGLWLQLIVQAVVAGAAAVLLIAPVAGDALSPAAALQLKLVAAWALVLHGLTLLAEGSLAPLGREREYHRAAALLTRGPWAARRWTLAVAVGVALPLVLLAIAPGSAVAGAVAGAAALVGLAVEEDLLVRAGQALPIS